MVSEMATVRFDVTVENDDETGEPMAVLHGVRRFDQEWLFLTADQAEEMAAQLMRVAKAIRKGAQ